MPELPEVETLAAQLNRQVAGKKIKRVLFFGGAVLKSPRRILEHEIPGSTVVKISRRGKFLSFQLKPDVSLWFHLGMTGQLFCRPKLPEKDPHLHLVLEFEACEQSLLFRDIRRFGGIFLLYGKEAAAPAGLQLLGPEPLDLQEEQFIGLFRTRTGRIKNLLLNQRIMAGLGNIYADESLFRAGIHPKVRSNRLSRPRLAGLLRAVKETLTEAIEHGGSTIDDYIHINGESGKFQNRHRVYGKKGKACIQCGTLIRCIRLAGRSASFCPECQK
jgi:formamidopyrimidine-DNA glycosylase